MILRLLIAALIVMAAYPVSACTSAIISAARSATGRPLLWKHRDTSNANSRVAYIAPNGNELAYVGIFNANDPKNHQAWMGFNEAGFAIMNTASYNLLPKGMKSNDREGYVMAAALKCCKTVDDFAAFLDSLPRPWGVEANFGVIDALGNGAFFETGNSDYVRYDLKDAQDGILIRTNYSYSGRPGEGSGYMRHKNAEHFLLPAARQCSITPEFLTETVSRSFYRDDLGRDLLSDTVSFVADIDFIPRYTTVATAVIEGMAPADSLPPSGDIAKEYIMWTGLGYAPLACILPVRISADGVDKGLQGQGANNHAPLADKAQNERKCLFFKDKVNKKGKGKRMVNLARLRQLMAPIKERNHSVYEQYKGR